jgi:hypothetical protein
MYSFVAVVPLKREVKDEKRKRKGEEEFLTSISILGTLLSLSYIVCESGQSGPSLLV